MPVINVDAALRTLQEELQEIGSRIPEGEVAYNPMQRRGRGSFGDVYQGQHDGIVSYQFLPFTIFGTKI